jgi:hypothetical protein
MKPVDYLAINQGSAAADDKLAVEIRNLLSEKWTLLGDFLMIRSTFKKHKRSNFTLILYFVLMGTTYCALWTSTFYVLNAKGGYRGQIWTCNIFFILSLVLCITIWKTPPGYLERKEDFEIVEILEQF